VQRLWPRAALVLGDHRQSLVVARSLARAGCEVILSSTGEPSASQHSRYIARCWQRPKLDRGASFFGASLAGFARTLPKGLIVFPVGDTEIADTAANLHALPPGSVAVMAAADTVHKCLNKATLYGLARRLGLAVADFEVSEPDQIEAAIGRVGLPCVVKPASSLEDVSHVKALMLEQAPSVAIAELVGTSGAGWSRALVQRRVVGKRHNCHFVAHHGHLLAYFEQTVLRTTRLDGAGYGVDGISVPPSAVRRGACQRLIEELDYSGPGCVQFLVGPAGESWFLELNARLDATCAIAERSGYDLPRLAVEEALYRGGDGPQPAALSRPYRVGVRGVWTTGDLRALLRELRTGNLSVSAALRWCGRMSWSFLRAHHHLTFRWSDPQPALRSILGMTVAPLWRHAKRLTYIYGPATP
jgi:Carbamoyl-phosphate synthase L chain, ATP binding domain